jgi:hypothetical protein
MHWIATSEKDANNEIATRGGHRFGLRTVGF